MTTDPLRRPEARQQLPAELFHTPARTDRPGFRWWWQSPLPPEALVRELRAMADAGFGEVEIAFLPGFWADGPQRAALQAVLDEAARLDIGVATTLGAAWPLQTPNTAKGSEHAAQELQYGVTYVPSAEPGPIVAPQAFDDPDAARLPRLLAVTAGRVVSRGDAPRLHVRQSAFGPRTYIKGADVPGVLDVSTLVDITGLVRDGSIDWDGRPGEWAIFAYWMRDCEQGVTSFLDRTAAIAATEYLDQNQFDDSIARGLLRTGTDLFEDSLELDADSLFWTPDLVSRFRRRFGYDPTPYLPGLFAHGMCNYWVPNDEPTPDFVFDDGSDRRVRRDYYRLVTELYINDHLLVLQEWSVSHGLRHKAQVAYGQSLEPVRANREFVRAGGHAEGESLNSGDRVPVSRAHPNWRFALDWQRSVVAGAHQGGATRISTELGAQFHAGYVFTLGDYKQLLDKEWAAGLTKPFVHGYASQDPGAEWPTQHRFGDVIAESWNDRHYPEWVNWRPLTDYWARGTVVLETGVPRCDVAIYRDGFLTTAARGVVDISQDYSAPHRLADAEPLERVGYTVQFVDPFGLIETGAVGGHGELFPDGPAYRVLVLNHLRLLPPDAAEAIDRAAAAGLVVVMVGTVPDSDDGFSGGDEGHERVRAAIARARERATVFCVDTMDAVPPVLHSAGVRPRAAWDDAPLLTQWRHGESADYVLVYNTDDRAACVDVSLEGAGGLRELDLWTGAARAVACRVEDGRTHFELETEGLGLHVFALCGAVEPAPAGLDRLGEPATTATPTDWELTVETEEPNGSRTIHVPGQGPADWRDIEELRDISGTGRYRARVAVPPGSRCEVRFVGLAGSAVVRAGGREFGPVYVSGQTVDVGDALSEDGVLEIEVRTALRNAVVASGLKPLVGSATQTQGLTGPVRVLVHGASRAKNG